MRHDERLDGMVSRFLTAWMGARQMIQAANFNRFQKAGLSATQFMTLNLIPAGEPTMTLGELARRMNLGAATVTETVKSLEARGLVSRSQSEADRRRVLLSLTREGCALQNAASEEFHEQMAGLFRRMNKEQRLSLVQGLEALLEANAGKGEVSDRAAPRKRRSSRRSPAA